MKEHLEYTPLTDRMSTSMRRQMVPEDYNHPLFRATTTVGLQQHLNQLLKDYQPDSKNQAFRILYDMQKLAYDGKGLRVETWWGTGSMNRPLYENVMLVKFTPNVQTDHTRYCEIERFWFEM